MQPRERLTAKEMQVAGLVWEGQTNREIARAIGTTEQVVKNYLRNTFDKLGVWSRLELAIYVARHGGERWQDEIAMQPRECHVGDDCFLNAVQRERCKRGKTAGESRPGCPAERSSAVSGPTCRRLFLSGGTFSLVCSWCDVSLQETTWRTAAPGCPVQAPRDAGFALPVKQVEPCSTGQPRAAVPT